MRPNSRLSKSSRGHRGCPRLGWPGQPSYAVRALNDPGTGIEVQRRKNDSSSPVVAIGIFLAIVTAVWETLTSSSRRRKPRAIALPVFLLIVGAVATAVGTYFVGFADDRRKREIGFAEQQVEKLYGPLFALSQATKKVSEDLFASRHNPGQDYFDPNDPPYEQEVEKWRLWIKTILQPMNVMMEEAIIKNAQLIEGGERGKIYKPFADLILHVESYKATIAKWKDTDAKANPHFTKGTENEASIPFPAKFDKCVEEAFIAMRAKTERLKSSLIPPFWKIEDKSFVATSCTPLWRRGGNIWERQWLHRRDRARAPRHN
jgi:hypothetical protein